MTYTEWLTEQGLVNLGEEEETVQLNIQVEDISDSEKGSDTGDLSGQEEVKGNLETEEKTVVEPQAEEKEVKEDEQIEGSGYVKSQDETDGQEKLVKLTEEVQSMLVEGKTEEDSIAKINRLQMILSLLMSSKTKKEDGKEIHGDSQTAVIHKKHVSPAKRDKPEKPQLKRSQCFEVIKVSEDKDDKGQTVSKDEIPPKGKVSEKSQKAAVCKMEV